MNGRPLGMYHIKSYSYYWSSALQNDRGHYSRMLIIKGVSFNQVNRYINYDPIQNLPVFPIVASHGPHSLHSPMDHQVMTHHPGL